MELHMFTIFDSKASAFIQPWYAPNPAVAKRMFGQAVNDPETSFAKHPADYTLFELGTFDQDTAEILLQPNLINHGLAVIFLEEETSPQPLSEVS